MTKKKKPGFAKMVAEFGKNWKTVTDTAKKKQKIIDSL